MQWVRLAFACVSLLAVPLLTAPSSAQSTPFVHLKRYAMGTVFEIVIYDDAPAQAESAGRAALDEVVRLDTLLSNYKPESELSRMNRTAHFQSVRISPELYDVIEQSLFYSRISGGQFDISVGPVVDLWKAALAGGALPDADKQAAALRCVGYQKIRLTPPDRIQFRSHCMRLDLGAIGKGYAVDRAVKLLKERGIQRAYIDAGGSTIYALGTLPDGKAWAVHLRDPSSKLNPAVMLTNNSVSTSEQSAPSLLQGDIPGHIILPGTGKPLRTRYAVSVTAASATSSDALSTTLLLLGPRKGMDLLKQLPSVCAIWIDSDGQRTIAGETARFRLDEGTDSVNAQSVGVADISKARQDSKQ